MVLFVAIGIRRTRLVNYASSQAKGAIVKDNRLSRGNGSLWLRKGDPSLSIFNLLDDAALICLTIAHFRMTSMGQSRRMAYDPAKLGGNKLIAIKGRMISSLFNKNDIAMHIFSYNKPSFTCTTNAQALA